MNIRNEYLVCYDIEDNKKRIKLFKLLQDYGLFSLQKSVFWGFLTKAECDAIARHISDNLAQSDKCLIAPITIRYRNKYTTCSGYQENDFQDWEEYGSL